jgi:hypothetical protein
MEPTQVRDPRLADELDSLNTELVQLEADLRKVERLVRESDASAEVKVLAAGLSSRLADVRQSRRELLARAGQDTKDD